MMTAGIESARKPLNQRRDRMSRTKPEWQAGNAGTTAFTNFLLILSVSQKSARGATHVSDTPGFLTPRTPLD